MVIISFFKNFHYNMNNNIAYDDNKKYYISGIIFYWGLYYSVDYNKAYELYNKAVGLGNSSAMNNLGYMYKREKV